MIKINLETKKNNFQNILYSNLKLKLFVPSIKKKEIYSSFYTFILIRFIYY